MAWFENDPGAVNVRGGILGPMTGSQKAAMLFAGLRDAVGNFSGRPTENLNSLAEQYGQMNYRQQVRQDRLSDKEATREAEKDRREWELANRDRKFETGINPQTGKMGRFYVAPGTKAPVFVDVELPAEAPKMRTIRMGMQDHSQEFDPLTGSWKTVAKGAAFKPDAPQKGPDAPSGYRWTGNGGMEFVPGGPADPRKGGGKKAPTEDQAKNTQLYTRAATQLPIVLENFDQLGMKGNQFGAAQSEAKVPLLGLPLGIPKNWVTSEGYQRASNALTDIAQTYLYSVSGAAATADEVKKIVDSVTPRFGESDKSKADKKTRVKEMVDSIKLRATPGQQPAAGNGEWSNFSVSP